MASFHLKHILTTRILPYAGILCEIVELEMQNDTPSLVNLHSSFEYLQNITLSRQFELLQIDWKNSLAQELEKEKNLGKGLGFQKHLTPNFTSVFETTASV